MLKWNFGPNPDHRHVRQRAYDVEISYLDSLRVLRPRILDLIHRAVVWQWSAVGRAPEEIAAEGSLVNVSFSYRFA